MQDRLDLLRRGGEIHREVREWIKPQLKPGIKLIDIANLIESKVKELTKYDPNDPLKAGVGFPTGVSLNNCGAHWTPNPSKSDYSISFGENDVCKIDFGVHLQGHIIDAAFTHTFNSKYDPLVEAAYEATQAASKAAGPDAILGEIGTIIEETIKSYEIELNGKTYQLNPLKDLCGHNIGPYRIHDNKAIPNVSMPIYKERMKSGEIYAVETFPSTGRGQSREDAANNSHYMINYQLPNWESIQVKPRDRKLLEKIKKNYSTLAFCPRWFNEPDYKKTQKSLDNLVKRKVLCPYPPLYDVRGSYVAQYEQTIAIKDDGIEILS